MSSALASCVPSICYCHILIGMQSWCALVLEDLEVDITKGDTGEYQPLSSAHILSHGIMCA